MFIRPDHRAGPRPADVQAHAEDAGLLEGDGAVGQGQEHHGEHLMLGEHGGDGEHRRGGQCRGADESSSACVPSRRTSASLAAPPARLRTTATANGSADSTRPCLAEAAAADQERVEPGLEEVVDVDVAERQPEHRQDGLRLEGGAPREAVAGGDAPSRLRSADAGASPCFSSGESRNHAYQTAAQTRPATPNTKNDIRQP